MKTFPKITIRVGGSTAAYTDNTVDTVYTVYTVYSNNTLNTVYTVERY